MTTDTIKSVCKYYDDCFTCPFPDCIEGQHIDSTKLKLQPKARVLFNQGFGVAQIVKKLGRCERTIRRYLNDN